MLQLMESINGFTEPDDSKRFTEASAKITLDVEEIATLQLQSQQTLALLVHARHEMIKVVSDPSISVLQ